MNLIAPIVLVGLWLISIGSLTKQRSKYQAIGEMLEAIGIIVAWLPLYVFLFIEALFK